MKARMLHAACAVLFPVALHAADRVKVSEFGYDPEDSTLFIQRAFDSGAKTVVLDRQAGPWYALPLKMRSNTELIIEDGVELVAKRGAFKGLRDFLLELPSVENCAIRGGKGATLRMWKSDYQGPDYKHGEWRYGLRLHHVTNVVVEGISVVESGGDGLGVTGKNITIRNCVFDRNHRQGASVFNVDGLLMENCVFSNTKGTPPAAGIDFEPDRNGWKMSNVIMRNCLFENNRGNGIELYLAKLREQTAPVSMRFENCRTVGNRNSVTVNPGARAGHHVKGNVTFVNCTFESSRGSGFCLSNKLADAFDVTVRDCVVSNPANACVSFSVGGSDWPGPTDGVALEGLTVYPAADKPWFRLGGQGFGPLATRISGNVRIVSPNGAVRTEKIDADWIARNLPLFNDGKIPPPRVAIPPAQSVKVVDAKPDELVELAPVSVLQKNRQYVFLAEKKGVVRFVGRQTTPVQGRALSKSPIRIWSLGDDGTLVRPVKVAQPLGVSTEFVFKAPRRGFYVMALPKANTRFCLEKSSVPVALDLSRGTATVAGRSAKPFSLLFDVPKATVFQTVVTGSDYYRFDCKIVAPSGKTVAACENVKSRQLIDGGNSPEEGLWRLDFTKAKEPHYDFIGIDLTGVPSVFFLSGEKYWR